jgi:hypothetical protein
MPGLAFPTVGPVGLSSPPSRPAPPAPCPRYYARLRLPSARPGSLRSRLLPGTLPAPSHSCLPSPAHWRLVAFRQCQDDWSPGRPFLPAQKPGFWVKETDGPPKFPSCPCERMPCSSTPVVPRTLALSPAGLLPSVENRTSAFPITPGYPYDHEDEHFGVPSHGLRPRYTRLRTPLTGLTRGFAADLLAGLWSGGTCTHWATLDSFHRRFSCSLSLGLTWRIFPRPSPLARSGGVCVRL